MDCLGSFFDSPLSDSGESIFWYFKYKQLHENSTKFEIAFRHVYCVQEKPWKNGSQEISLDYPFNKKIKQVIISYIIFIYRVCPGDCTNSARIILFGLVRGNRTDRRKVEISHVLSRGVYAKKSAGNLYSFLLQIFISKESRHWRRVLLSANLGRKKVYILQQRSHTSYTEVTNHMHASDCVDQSHAGIRLWATVQQSYVHSNV
jgi:hypothetical protein